MHLLVTFSPVNCLIMHGVRQIKSSQSLLITGSSLFCCTFASWLTISVPYFALKHGACPGLRGRSVGRNAGTSRSAVALCAMQSKRNKSMWEFNVCGETFSAATCFLMFSQHIKQAYFIQMLHRSNYYAAKLYGENKSGKGRNQKQCVKNVIKMRCL